MGVTANNTPDHTLNGNAIQAKHYRDLLHKNLLRLFVSYLLPLILLIFYFQYQYNALQHESKMLHMKSIAENESNTLNLFLQERLVNLSNIIEDPKFSIPPSLEVMQEYLNNLKRDSDTFIDIGYFDPSGILAAYAGPLPTLEKRNYSQESWYIDLKNKVDRYIITDIYLGFRQEPHFTIAVSRVINGRYVVLRATMDPRKIYEYISGFKGSGDTYISIINHDGFYQVVTPQVGTVLEKSQFVPSESPPLGMAEDTVDGRTMPYAYAWLNSANWVVIVQPSTVNGGITLFGTGINIVAFSMVFVLVILMVIIIRAKKLVKYEQEKDIVRTQLEHASKLASVGELASGIAHEINNPLAIIASEVGLMRDIMDPEFNEGTTFDDLTPHMDNIHEACYRCRDITSKLLSFVRRTEFDLKKQHVHDVIDEMLEGFVLHEMKVSNIDIIRKYGDDIPEIVTDGNQLEQVVLNMVNNAVDAIKPPGKIIISTHNAGKNIIIRVSDTGSGMTEEQISKIFLPFYTTKEVGKGTGLGLSVSYGIIKNLGGKIDVDSKPGKGSTFSVILPVH